MVEGLYIRLLAKGILSIGFSNHNFRQGLAQHTFDNGMLNKNIQKLGYWTSVSVSLYFVTLTQMLYNFNINFQTGYSMALS